MPCPTDTDRWVVSHDTPQGRGDAENAKRAGNPSGIHAAAMADDVFFQENNWRDEFTNRILSLFDENQPFDELPATSKNVVNGMAKDLRRYEERLRQGKEYQRIQQENWDRDFRILGTMSSGVRSMWLDWTTKADTFATNARALFDKWAMLFAVQKDKSFLDNEFISRAYNVDANIAGQVERMQPLLRAFEDFAAPIAHRLGYKVEDMYTILGEGANAIAAPEKNAYLMQKWNEQLNKELMKPANKMDLSKVKDLETKIFNLELFLDDDRPPLQLYSSGITNGQARRMLERIMDLGVTRQEIEQASAHLTKAFQGIYNELVKQGLIPPEVHANMPDLPHYVAYQTKFDNSSGPVNDTHAYNPGAYHEMQGSRVPPDSAYWTARAYLRRAATEIGTQDMARLLAAKASYDKVNHIDSGLRLYSYKQIQHFATSENPAVRRWAQNFQSEGGYVAWVKTFNDEGVETGIKRMYVCFDPSWEDPRSGLTGKALNAALVAAPKAQSGVAKTMSKLNSGYGMFFTRMRPAFAPVAGMRDFIERSFHIANADVTATDGSHVAGWTLLPKYFANTFGATRAVMEGTLYGQAGGNMGQYWKEFSDLGLHFVRTYGMGEVHRTFDQVDAARSAVSPMEKAVGEPRMRDLRKSLELAKGSYRQVMSVLDSWNDYFMNIAPFTQYVTLRKAGISPEKAQTQVLGSMHAYQSGTSTPVARALFPFVKPTLQGSRAHARAFGLMYDPRGFVKAGKNGWIYGAGMFALGSALLPLIRESMGYDDTTGESRYDAIPLSMASKIIPVGLGNGDYFKMQVGYGWPQEIMALVVGRDRVANGKMSMSDFAQEMTYITMQNLFPGNWPDFDFKDNPFAYVLHSLTPSFAAPLVALGTNTTHFGAPIDRSTSYNASVPKAIQGRSSTPMAFHDAARWLNKAWGIDLAPEQLKAAADEMLIGPLEMCRILWDESVRKGSRDIPMSERLSPVARMLGGQLLFGSSNNIGRKLFYDAYDDITRQIRRKNIRLTSNVYGRDTAKRIAYQTEKLRDAGFDEDFIQDYFTLEAALKQLSSGSTDLNRKMRQMYEESTSAEEFREMFNERAEEEAGIYDEAVNSLNYYRGRV